MKHQIVKSKEFQRIEIDFTEWLKTSGYSDSIIESITSSIRDFFHSLVKTEGITKLIQITSEYIEYYYNNLSNRKKHLHALKIFSKYLQKIHYISLNIIIKEDRVERKIKHVLTRKEINKLITSVEYNPIGLRDRAMIGIYYGCGLRLNEGINLELEDIIFDKQLIYVRKGRNERYVPMNEKVMVYLRDYINYGRLPLLKAKENNLDNRYFFINYNGEKVQTRTLQRRLKVLQKKSNDTSLIKKDIRINTLRHTIGTHLIQQGMNLESVKEFLGCKSIRETQIYAHLVHEL